MTRDEWQERVDRGELFICEYVTPAVIEPVTRCKHGRGDCDECGTSDRRDAVHTTKSGRGVVGRLTR